MSIARTVAAPTEAALGRTTTQVALAEAVERSDEFVQLLDNELGGHQLLVGRTGSAVDAALARLHANAPTILDDTEVGRRESHAAGGGGGGLAAARGGSTAANWTTSLEFTAVALRSAAGGLRDCVGRSVHWGRALAERVRGGAGSDDRVMCAWAGARALRAWRRLP